MEAAAAIGLASSILTFVDFGFKIATATVEISKVGQTTDHGHVALLVDDFDAVVEPIRGTPVSSGCSENERGLHELCERCQPLAEELRKLLQKLQVAPGASKWDGFRAALRGMRKAGELSALEGRLNDIRRAIMMRFMAILEERNLTILVELGALNSESAKRSADMLSKLKDAHQVLENAGKTLRKQEDVLVGIEDQLKPISELQKLVDDLVQMKRQDSPEMGILKELYSDSIYRRKETIVDAVEGTFSWILENPPGPVGAHCAKTKDSIQSEPPCKPCDSRVRLLQWLRNGEGVFHISGKPGSGKSTLAKLLLKENRTRLELEKWADNTPMIMAHFFFWAVGDTLEKTIEGLHRAIAFQVVLQRPDLCKSLFPKRHARLSPTRQPSDRSSDDQQSRFTSFLRRKYGISPQELEAGFHRLLSNPNLGFRLCMFIDGLDEFLDAGEQVNLVKYRDLAESIKSWASEPHVKILSTSRPYAQFLRTFDETQQIHLHEITHWDISRFTSDTLSEKLRDPGMEEHVPGWVKEISDNAEGVFLWARLAVVSLLNAVELGSSPEEIKQELKLIPKDINSLYEKLLSLGRDIDRQKAVNIIGMVASVASRLFSPMPALSVLMMDKLRDPMFPFNNSVLPVSKQELKVLEERAIQQVQGLTHGLLTVGSFFYAVPGGGKRHISLFHRTARDFILSPSTERKVDIEFDLSFHVRLMWALCQLGKNDSTDSYDHMHGYFVYFQMAMFILGDQQRYDILDKIKTEFDTGNAPQWMLDCTYRSINIQIVTLHTAIPNDIFFLRFAACLGMHEYVLRHVRAERRLLNRGHGASLLYSSLSRGPSGFKQGRLSLVRDLLALGADPRESVLLRMCGQETTSWTVWQIVCAVYLQKIVQTGPKRACSWALGNEVALEFSVLELFLEHGCDGQVSLLLAPIWECTEPWPCNTSCGRIQNEVTLLDLVVYWNPPNHDNLIKLLDRRGPWEKLKVWMSLGPPDSQGLDPEISSFSDINKYVRRIHTLKWSDVEIDIRYMDKTCYWDKMDI